MHILFHECGFISLFLIKVHTEFLALIWIFSFVFSFQRNGDKIDRTHFKNMWYQYLMDEKADDSPGNYLFGNVQS